MSTDYVTMKEIPFDDLFDGRLEKFGVREHIKDDEASDTRRCLTDGNNYLWTYASEDRTLACLTRFFPNGAPEKILGAIAEAFDTDIFSEYEPQYWGFDSQEEWDLAWEKIAEEQDAEFHAEIIKHVAGKPNNLKPGTIGMIRADIAKNLVAENPGLVSPDKKAKLMEEIEQVYQAEHAVMIKLDERDIAAARMAVTHEDDLPQV